LEGIKMKRIMIMIFAVVTLTSSYSDFCEGYRIGYKKGYCYGKNFCLEPLAPLCPLPNLGERGFYDGYNRGFLDGVNNG
jgi:hypothetical protein